MPTASKEPDASRRKDGIYGLNHLPGAHASAISLMSNTTDLSSGSGGSASTITQESYSKSHKGSEKRRKGRRSSSSGDGASEKRTLESIATSKEVDVFKFLVNDDSVEKNQPHMEMTGSQSLVPLKREAEESPVDTDYESFYRSQQSDCGMSMDGIVVDPQIDGFMKHPLSPLIEETNEFSTYIPTVPDHYYQQEPPTWSHMNGPVYGPEPIPLSPASIRSHAYPQEYVYRGTPDPPSMSGPSVASLDFAPLVFRDRGTRNSQHPQIFRSFAHLNEKVLLQMQSNIADLEHELAALDAKACAAEANARSRKGEGVNTSRYFAKGQSTRAEIYQEIHSNLEQYYEALSSFHRLTQISTACTPSDSSHLKSWLRSHVAPLPKTSALTGDGTDLIRLGHVPHNSRDETLRVIAYGVFINIFTPLLLFKLTSGILWRMIVLSVTTTTATFIMDRHRANASAELSDLHWHCILGCASVSLFAGLLF